MRIDGCPGYWVSVTTDDAMVSIRDVVLLVGSASAFAATGRIGCVSTNDVLRCILSVSFVPLANRRIKRQRAFGEELDVRDYAKARMAYWPCLVYEGKLLGPSPALTIDGVFQIERET